MTKRTIELTQGLARVIVELGADETMTEGAYRTLKSRTSDDSELRLLLGEVDGLVQEALAARRAARSARPTDRDARLSQLAESFPTLAGCPGVRPWDSETFVAQLQESWPGSGARSALKFVAHVWNVAHPFDLDDFSKWDAAHQKAFARWAADPWWA